MAASNPFDPYQISWDPKHELAAFAYLATVIGLPASTADDVAATFTNAAKAHKKISATKAGLYGIGAAAALGSAGFLAAPVVGAALGSAAGSQHRSLSTTRPNGLPPARHQSSTSGLGQLPRRRWGRAPALLVTDTCLRREKHRWVCAHRSSPRQATRALAHRTRRR